MQKSRLIALLLAVAMVMSMIVVPASAEGSEPYTMKLADASNNTEITATPGSTVELYLSIANNPGILGAGAYITHPEGWTVNVDMTPASTTLSTATMLNPIQETISTTCYEVSFISAGTAANGLVFGDGNLAKLTFTVPADAEKTTYNFTLDTTNESGRGVVNASANVEGDVIVGEPYDIGNDITAVNCSVTVVAEPTCSLHGEVEWTAWDGTTNFANGGHYYLAGPVQLSGMKYIEGVTACLDLRGQTITTAANKRFAQVSHGSQFTVMDSSAEKTGTIKGNGATSTTGGLFYVSSENTVLNIYSGNFIDGDAGFSTTDHRGGCIYANQATKVNIYGGNFSNCKAYQGGIIFANTYATVNISGGNLSNGTAKHRGGIIAGDGTSTTATSKVNISGDAIIGTGTSNDWDVTKGLWSLDYTKYTISGNAQVANACLPNGTVLNMMGGTVSQVEVRSGSTFTMYGGHVKTLSGNAGATINNGIVDTVTATGTITVGSCSNDLSGIVGKTVTHAAGTCATCGHTYSAIGANTECTTCKAVHEVSFNGTCEKHDAVTAWTPWDGTAAFADGGHYYLTGNVELTGQKYVNAIKVCLDLRGYTITTAANTRFVQVQSGGEFTVMDSSVGMTGTIKGNGTTAEGGLFRVTSENTVLNIYGGNFINGKTDTTKADYNTSTKNYGGCIYANTSTKVNIYDGNFSNCEAYRGGIIFVQGYATLTIQKGTFSGGNAYQGGIICGNTNSRINISGGNFSNGVASYQGGIIFVFSNVNVNISGGHFSSGTSTSHRGGILAADASSTSRTKVNVSGDAIIDAGASPTWAETKGLWAADYTDFTISGNAQVANVCLPSGTVLNMMGGTVSQVEVRSGSTFKMYGGHVIKLSGNAGATINNGIVDTVTATGTITVGSCSNDLSGETGKNVLHKIGLCATCGHTYSAIDANTECTTCEAVHETIRCSHVFEGNTCTVCGYVSVAPTTCAHCGDVDNWTIFTPGVSLANGGHYYLPDDVTLTAAFAVNGSSASNKKTVCLNLNGHSLTAAPDQRLISQMWQATLNVDGTTEGSAILGNGVRSSGNGLIYITTGGVLNMIGGNISGGAVDASSNVQGGNLYLANAGATANLTNVTVSNGRANYRGGNISIADGATVNLRGSTVVTGGQLYKDDALISASGEVPQRGGNIYVGTNGTLNIYDNAKVTGGEGGFADANNVFMVKATLNMYGGEITDGNFYYGYDTNLPVIYNGVVESVLPLDETARGACACVTKSGNTYTFSHVGGSSCTCEYDYSNTTIAPVTHTYGAGANAGEIACKYCGTALIVPAGTVAVTSDGQIHTTLADALANGKSITLVDDVTVADVTLTVPLNLNGKVLTITGQLNAITGDIVDAAGTGKLVTTNNAPLFNSSNNMLPVQTATGEFVFEKPDMTKKFHPSYNYTPGVASAKYCFYSNTTAANTAINEALAAGTLTIEVYVEWTDGEGNHNKTFTLQGEVVQQFAQNENWDNKMISLNLNGLEEVTALSCTARFVSNGVTVA